MRKTLVLILLLALPPAWNQAVAENIFSQDFESVWDLNTPPAGWSVIDRGSEGQQCWYTQDWHKIFYSSWADTVFGFFVGGQKLEIGYDEWLITPGVALPGEATACSLTFETFYDDQNTTTLGDTAFIKITTDDGSNWTTLVTWGTDQGSFSAPIPVTIDATSYKGNTVKFAFNLKTHGTTTHSAANRWYVDDIAIWSDASTLLSHDGTGWGPWGDSPPAGWTIYDYGTPAPAQGVPNVNDWYKWADPSWGSNTARVYWTTNTTYPEYEDEWMISPAFSITAGYACTLSFAQYYKHVLSTPYDGDHGYIYLSTDGGSTWPFTIADLVEETGDAYTKTFFKYDLASFAGENNLKIAFNRVNYPTTNEHWMIDDVSMDQYVPLTQDPAVVGIDAPPDLILTGGNYTITAVIENLLSDSTIIDSVLFAVDTGAVVLFSNTTYPAVYLQGYASEEFSSSAQWNPTFDGKHTVTMTVYGSGDQNPLNNSYVAARFAQSVVAFPFEENFEDGPVTSVSDWVGLGMGFGTTSNAHSPVTALWFDDDEIYPAERLAVSPPIYVSGSVDPRLRFWERSAGADGPEGEEVHTVGLVPGDWDMHNFAILFQEDTSSTTLQDSLWRESVVDAGDIEGDTVRVLIWYHCGDFPDRSWYVDDVSLVSAIGTVAGQVTDANTTDPVEGAVVTATWVSSTTAVDTTDSGGNYSLKITAGTVNITVEAAGYVTDSQDVTVTADQVTTHNVALNAPLATIDTAPIFDVVQIGDTAMHSRFLYNTGSVQLDYNVTVEDVPGVPAVMNIRVNLTNGKDAAPSLALKKEPLPVILDVTWMTVISGQAGSLVPGDSVEIVFLVDFTDSTIVADSTYNADATFNNNDPYRDPVISFHIDAIYPMGRCCYDGTLCADNTEPECIALSGTWDPDLNCRDNPCPPPGCDYVMGDVNGSDSYNGLDITYGVNYFKGGSDPMCPLGSCSIPPCDAFFYCGDVNGSCSYNGLDITYGVSYFKGGSEPIYCMDCPPR
jgi:hypothetical protein